MDSSAAGPNNAQQQQRRQQRPPPSSQSRPSSSSSSPSPALSSSSSPVQEAQPWDSTSSLSKETAAATAGGVLDGFDMQVDSKNALISFITTGKAPKDEIKQLYDLCLSGLVSKNNNNDAIECPSIAPVKNSSPTTSLLPDSPDTSALALPPTPETTEDETPPAQNQDLVQKNLTEFFTTLLSSGKIPSASIEILYKLSPLAEMQSYAAFAQRRWPSSSGLGGQIYAPVPTAHGHFDPAFSQQQNLFPRASQLYNSFGGGFSAPDPYAPDGQLSPTFPLANGFGMQPTSSQGASAPPSIAPPTLDPQGFQLPAQPQASLPDTFMSSFNNESLANQQSGLPSPVGTRASSQSEGSSTPNNPQANENTTEVVCPIANADGTICGKSCSGSKRWRSIQEHIRRAHSEKWIQNLPANEESFHTMVQAGGIACTIPDEKTHIPCGRRFSGNKKWRLVQDHVRDEHPDYYVGNLPANESTFNILMTKDDTVDCPLPGKDGKPCTKHTFGEKRYRSLQEHIRRAHNEFYIANLHATEESIIKMCEKAGVTLAPPRRSKKPGSQKTKASAPQSRPQPRIRASEPAAQPNQAPAVPEQKIAAAPRADTPHPTLDPSYFPQQVPTTLPETLVPADLNADFSPLPLSMSVAAQPEQLYMQYLQLLAEQPNSNVLSHTGLGTHLAQSVATPTAQNLDQTLTTPLFGSQANEGQSFMTGPGQFPQSTQALFPTHGMNLLSPFPFSESDPFLQPAASTMPEQQHPTSLSPTFRSNRPVNLKPIGSDRKRKLGEASERHGSFSEAQGQPKKKSSLRQTSSAPASAVQNGAPISPIFLAPSLQSQPVAGSNAGIAELGNPSAPLRIQPVPYSQGPNGLNVTPTRTQPFPQFSSYVCSPLSAGSNGIDEFNPTAMDAMDAMGHEMQ